jgi:hypothetical protein
MTEFVPRFLEQLKGWVDGPPVMIGAISSNGRSPEAARQLASRARRRVRAVDTVPDSDLILSARPSRPSWWPPAKEISIGWVAVLDPDVVVKVDFGPGRSEEVRGAEAVARQARAYALPGLVSHRVLINGAIGIVTTRDGQPFSVGG